MTMKTTKTNRKIKKAYFDWLYHQVEVKEFLGLENFISELYEIPFYCLIPNDDNRAKDGLQLRDRFLDGLDADYPDDVLPWPCTVLEMLIALANRMDFILFDHSKGSRYAIYFWLFINNLKLQKYNNDDKNVEKKEKFNRLVLKKFVKREYQADGKGGLFPLDDPLNDQRNVEIWYQMMEYISENYDI